MEVREKKKDEGFLRMWNESLCIFIWCVYKHFVQRHLYMKSWASGRYLCIKTTSEFKEFFCCTLARWRMQMFLGFIAVANMFLIWISKIYEYPANEVKFHSHNFCYLIIGIITSRRNMVCYFHQDRDALFGHVCRNV